MCVRKIPHSAGSFSYSVLDNFILRPLGGVNNRADAIRLQIKKITGALQWFCVNGDRLANYQETLNNLRFLMLTLKTWLP